MDAMGLYPRTPKPVPLIDGDWEASVDQAVMKEKINRPIGGDAEAKGQKPERDIDPKPDEQDRRGREHDREKIVQLKYALLLGVMAFVPAPHEPVHDKAMGDPGEAFHADERGKKNRDFGEDHDHHHILTRQGRPRPAPILTPRREAPRVWL